MLNDWFLFYIMFLFYLYYDDSIGFFFLRFNDLDQVFIIYFTVKNRSICFLLIQSRIKMLISIHILADSGCIDPFMTDGLKK